MITTKTRILKMEKQRVGRIKGTFQGMSDAEFCHMLNIPRHGQTDAQLQALVATGIVEDWTAAYYPRAADKWVPA